MVEKILPARYIGIDYGMARIGLSFSDEQRIIAFPMSVVQSPRKLNLAVQKVLETIQDHQKSVGYTLEAVIVGMPLMMSGRKGLMADEVNAFMTALSDLLTDTPVIPWDERLSSVQAERSMREANMSRKKRTKSIDSVSAVIILQSYLDHLFLRRD